MKYFSILAWLTAATASGADNVAAPADVELVTFSAAGGGDAAAGAVEAEESKSLTDDVLVHILSYAVKPAEMQPEAKGDVQGELDVVGLSAVPIVNKQFKKVFQKVLLELLDPDSTEATALRIDLYPKSLEAIAFHSESPENTNTRGGGGADVSSVAAAGVPDPEAVKLGLQRIEEIGKNAYAKEVFLAQREYLSTVASLREKNRKASLIGLTANLKKLIAIANVKNPKKRVVQVAVAMEHYIFLIAEGAVLTCGTGVYGRLGHGDEEYQQKPKRVCGPLENEIVVGVAAGLQHSVFVTKAEAVFTCGAGSVRLEVATLGETITLMHFRGWLGHGDEENQLQPKRVEWPIKDLPVVKVAAGHYHSVFVTKAGAVYTCGAGFRGMLGHGNTEDQLQPARIIALGPYRVVYVTVELDHTIFLTARGAVFNCGVHLGQLSQGKRENQLEPKRVGGPLKGQQVVQVASGFNHLAFLTKVGKVLMCGSGYPGWLAHGNRENQQKPKCVGGALEAQEVVYMAVAVGQVRNVFVTKNGAVYASGTMPNGQHYNKPILTTPEKTPGLYRGGGGGRGATAPLFFCSPIDDDVAAARSAAAFATSSAIKDFSYKLTANSDDK